MVGANNSRTSTAPEIAEGVGDVVLELRKDSPDAKIFLPAISPGGTPGDPVRAKLAQVTGIISKLDDGRHVIYVDIASGFLDQKGYFLPDAFHADNRHPPAKAYDIWGTPVMKDKLAESMK